MEANIKAVYKKQMLINAHKMHDIPDKPRFLIIYAKINCNSKKLNIII